MALSMLVCVMYPTHPHQHIPPHLLPSTFTFSNCLKLVSLSADILAHIMNDLFGGVVYAGIDTDRYKYPIGSGRVTFGNQKSFMKAVKAGFVEIKTGKFTKKVCTLYFRMLPGNS